MSIFYFQHCWVIFSINCFQKLFQSSIISNLQKFNGEDSQFHTVQTHYRWNFNLLLQKLQHWLHKISLNSLLPQLKSHLVNKDTTTSCECNEMAVACISLGISNFYSKNGCFWLLYLHYLLPHLMPFGIWTHVNVVTFGELSLCNCRIDTHTSLPWQHKKVSHVCQIIFDPLHYFDVNMLRTLSSERLLLEKVLTLLSPIIWIW